MVNKKTHVRTDRSWCYRHTHGLVSWDCDAHYQGNSLVLQGHLRWFFICPFVQLHELLFPQHTHGHTHNIVRVHVLPGTLKKSGHCWKDTMATKANQTTVEAAAVDRCTSALSSSSKPTREVRNANSSQELQRYYDQLWNSNQRSSPPLIFYRKLSCDGEKGFISNACVDCSPEVCAKSYPELSTGIDGITNSVPSISSERAPCQLDSPGEGGQADRNRTGNTHCSCAMSSPRLIPNIDCCLSHTSSHLSPGDNPSLCPSPTHPKQRHGRRSSLPVSMMAFHKVIEAHLH